MPKKTTEKNTKDTKKKEETTKKVETKVVKEKKEVFKKGKENVNSALKKTMNNTPFVIALCAAVLLLGALILTLCTKRIPKTSKGEEIVASIKGEEITAEELYQSLKNSYGTNTLINLIDTYIADKEVTITDDDKDYVKEVVNYYKDYADYYGTDLATFLANYVGLSGITTEDEFYDYVLTDYKKSLAVQNFVGDSASEEDLKEYYENNYSDSLTVRHILIEIDSDDEDTEKAEQEAYNKAVSLIKKLDKTDTDKLTEKFEELAKENSDDNQTYDEGGLIEDFTKVEVEDEFFNASSELEDGEYTKEPIKTSYGYHVILKVSSTPVKKYKEIKDEVKKAYAANLLSSNSNLQITKWDELRKQYKLSINDDTIKDLYNDTIKNAKTEN